MKSSFNSLVSHRIRLTALGSLVLASFGVADLKLSELISDHMVLQQGQKNALFGFETPGTEISVKVTRGDSKKPLFEGTTKAVNDGAWTILLPAMKPGAPLTITIKGSTEAVVSDVLVGEVWVCSGQSNMEWSVNAAKDPGKELAESDPNVRMFTVPKRAIGAPQSFIPNGKWVPSSPQTAGSFSAVGFSFAKHLYAKLKVPIGMIHTSWGGTPAEAWTDIEWMAKDPMTKPMVDRAQSALDPNGASAANYRKALLDWQKANIPLQDQIMPAARPWSAPNWDDSTRTKVKLPHFFEDGFDGTAWYRYTVDLTADQVAKIQSLELPGIDDLDRTWVNGVEIGRTDSDTPNSWMMPRSYKVGSALKAGKNVIAVRALDYQQGGGITGEGQATLKGGGVTVALDGEWRFSVEQPLSKPVPNNRPREPWGPTNPNFPQSLMNGMIRPVVPYGIKGAIWYQGESNAGRALQYKTLFPMMIQNWRALWGRGDFPFHFVQLANYMDYTPTKFDDAWPELREAQRLTLSLPNTGMAVIMDVGDPNDIHPRDKRTVGDRLARIALHQDYGMKGIVHEGPFFQKTEVRGSEMVVKFRSAKGLQTNDYRLPRGFTILGEDGKWRVADAKIEGETVVVSHPDVKAPKAVRYAWYNHLPVNLVNAEGLPAVPFKSDDLPWITKDNR